MTLLTERYAPQIAGVLSCWDRILVFGTLPKVCFAEGMTSYLYEHKIRIFDYPRFAEPFRNVLRENAERLAGESGWKSSSCASATCERRTGSSRSSTSGAIIRGWYAVSVRASPSFQAAPAFDAVGVWTNNDDQGGDETVKKPTCWQWNVKRAGSANGSSASSAECR